MYTNRITDGLDSTFDVNIIHCTIPKISPFRHRAHSQPYSTYNVTFKTKRIKTKNKHKSNEIKREKNKINKIKHIKSLACLKYP